MRPVCDDATVESYQIKGNDARRAFQVGQCELMHCGRRKLWRLFGFDGGVSGCQLQMVRHLIRRLVLPQTKLGGATVIWAASFPAPFSTRCSTIRNLDTIPAFIVNFLQSSTSIRALIHVIYQAVIILYRCAFLTVPSAKHSNNEPRKTGNDCRLEIAQKKRPRPRHHWAQIRSEQSHLQTETGPTTTATTALRSFKLREPWTISHAGRAIGTIRGG